MKGGCELNKLLAERRLAELSGPIAPTDKLQRVTKCHKVPRVLLSNVLDTQAAEKRLNERSCCRWENKTSKYITNKKDCEKDFGWIRLARFRDW